jgi:putative FmdB family regulatory protein
MPIYEYRCTACRRKVTVLTMRVSEAIDPVCEHCGSRDLIRLLSRFAMVRPKTRLDDSRTTLPRDVDERPQEHGALDEEDGQRAWRDLPSTSPP